MDDRDLKTSDNYWQRFTLAPGQKFHFLINDKPVKEGAWEVTINAGHRTRHSAIFSTPGG